ncbi:MAG TPA: glycosyltransferase family 39 protein, partial [Caulobacteraceae bacterium]|nr:glycosyltransferase family 39 protein [Caulobacteraceae bacterium]
WSQHLAFGYFTKPPLVAWIIRLTTLMGDAEPLVRLSSPLLHAAAAIFVFLAANRLYEARTALFALLTYALMPAVQLGGFIVSTDTPMVACLAAALWAYVALQQTERAAWRPALGLGLALGLAFLAKYAALYSVAGIALHLITSREARKVWRPTTIAVAVGAFALVIAPNLAWNAVNGFAAAHHVASEAAWGGPRKGGVLAVLSFIGSQFGVFGPIPFAVLAGGGVWLAARRRLQAPDRLLLAWTIPPLAIVLVQAFIAGAKANWAAAALAPGSILVAAWMLRWNRPRLLIAVLAAQALLAVGGLVAVTQPRLLDQVGLSSALKGVRGGRELTAMVVERAQAQPPSAPLTAVAVDDRALFNLVAYYGRGYFGVAGPPLKAWLPGPAPTSEAELATPLTAANGARVLAVSHDGAYTPMMRSQFQSAGETEIGTVWLDRKHHRGLAMFVGEGFKGR